MARVAELLGTPFMPWQHYVENVAGEVLDDGRMAYPLVVCLVPRRAGKTLATVARKIQRCSIGPRRRAWYTAQTGGDAGKTFRQEWVPLVKPSRLGASIKTRLSNGSESMTLLRNLSQIGLFPPTETGIHGQPADDVTIDEAWAFTDLKGTQIEAGVRPAMATRRGRQLWIVSAGGTDESTWLLRYRELGRAIGVEPDQGMAYFEWGPPVDEHGRPTVDLDDPATWAMVHPAVGHTIDLDTLREDWKTFPRDVFYRSYLNVFQAADGVRLIPDAPWQDCKDEAAAVQPGEGIVCAYDVALDYSASAVTFTQRRGDGRYVTEVVAYDSGDSWLADKVVELRRRYGCQLVANGAGPVRATTRALADRGLDVRELNEREFVDASGELVRDICLPDQRRFVHRGQPPLDRAAAGAGRRELGDGWALTRKGSTAEVSPLIAAACGTWLARRPPAREPRIILGTTAV